ncbi:zinc ribbon domain-containing protein, partial [candidate division KSB1 bacterium]|nr:zinc ribbon domain-containing protein [candidate division KSB1 bacterium]NIV69352.1 zinc ribbon domain-containing protein [Phycisphaerae bacterium]NIR71049.1 zinc ribbon domain-containing protein [candidate division KSB1 bacterium]NIS23330.1 zinc ribbon domain-containing protein [candidate division KSB1 bacterium]NIT74764.1 zinc ribbon domain-containing protein [candidate division KSB1 bacterium]
PVYEYQCKKCWEKFEVLQKVGADDTDLNCPNCGAPNPEKVFSLFSSAGSKSESWGSA